MSSQAAYPVLGHIFWDCLQWQFFSVVYHTVSVYCFFTQTKTIQSTPQLVWPNLPKEWPRFQWSQSKPRSSKSSRFMHFSSKRPLLLAGPWAETDQNPKLEITNSEHSLRYLKIWVPYLCRLRKMVAKLLPSDRDFVWHHAACSLALCGILRKVTRDIHPSVRRHKRKAVQGAKTYSNERHIPCFPSSLCQTQQASHVLPVCDSTTIPAKVRSCESTLVPNFVVAALQWGRHLSAASPLGFSLPGIRLNDTYVNCRSAECQVRHTWNLCGLQILFQTSAKISPSFDSHQPTPRSWSPASPKPALGLKFQ